MAWPWTAALFCSAQRSWAVPRVEYGSGTPLPLGIPSRVLRRGQFSTQHQSTRMPHGSCTSVLSQHASWMRGAAAPERLGRSYSTVPIVRETEGHKAPHPSSYHASTNSSLDSAVPYLQSCP
ncbi:hypothetical protein BJ546DRAFT_950532 [Cryomyces antarcticus]